MSRRASRERGEAVSNDLNICDYCGEPIRNGQPTLPDVDSVVPGKRIHLDCACDQDDGCDIDNETGDQ